MATMSPLRQRMIEDMCSARRLNGHCRQSNPYLYTTMLLPTMPAAGMGTEYPYMTRLGRKCRDNNFTTRGLRSASRAREGIRRIRESRRRALRPSNTA
jgi:hypothetical protein